MADALLTLILHMFLQPIEAFINILPDVDPEIVNSLWMQDMGTMLYWVGNLINVPAFIAVTGIIVAFEIMLFAYRIIVYVYRLLPLT